MEVKGFKIGPFITNSYLFYDINTKKAIIFDVGGEDIDNLLKFLNDNELELSYIIITHGHADHIAGVDLLRKLTNAKVIVHKNDDEMLLDFTKNMSEWILGKKISLEADIFISDDVEMDLSGIKVKFYHTPGHTKGAMCVIIDKYLITGDTVFKDTIGRTDFYGGNYETILKSLVKIQGLGDDLIILPAHNETTTMKYEKQNNPYFKEALE